MKKLTTKLLMSIIAVAFAFVALGTSTYAWFSMNTTVTATGMSITAKADQTFLVIANADSDLAVTATSANANTATAEIYPAKYKELSGTTPIWQTAYSNNPDSADKAEGSNYADVAAADASKYVLANTFYIKVANGAVSAANLKLSGVSVDKENSVSSVFESAVSVLVVVGETAVNCVNGALPETNPTLAATVTDSAFITVNVYVYFNGDQASVKTNNATAINLVAIPVELTFSVDGVASGN